MNKVLLVVAITLVVGGLIAGFSIVGGPGYARMEKMDAQRVSDLRQLGGYYQCENLSEAAEVPARCKGGRERPDTTDPVTSEPYRFSRVDENMYEVCATFQTDMTNENSSAHSASLYVEGENGCLRYKRATADANWALQRN